MSGTDYAEHTRAGVRFEQWMSECSLWWMAHNEEDAYEWPAYPWRQWYDDGLSVRRAIEEANRKLFGRPQGA